MVYLLYFLKTNNKSKLCGKKAIIEDLQEAGWSMKKPRENEKISDLDLRHIFDKVDLNQDSYVNRMVISVMEKRGDIFSPIFFVHVAYRKCDWHAAIFASSLTGPTKE